MSNKILIPVFITFTLFVSQTTQSNKYVLHHSQMQIMPRHTLLNNDSTPKSLEEIQREQGKIKNSRKNQRITHKKRQKQLRVEKEKLTKEQVRLKKAQTQLKKEQKEITKETLNNNLLFLRKHLFNPSRNRNNIPGKHQNTCLYPQYTLSLL